MSQNQNQEQQAPKFFLVSEEVLAATVDFIGTRPGSAGKVISENLQRHSIPMDEEELQFIQTHRDELAEQEKAQKLEAEKKALKVVKPRKNSQKGKK